MPQAVIVVENLARWRQRWLLAPLRHERLVKILVELVEPCLDVEGFHQIHSVCDARSAFLTMPFGVAIAAATRAVIASPVCGATSNPMASASFRNAWSCTVAS